jgi:hypothetical protein
MGNRVKKRLDIHDLMTDVGDGFDRYPVKIVVLANACTLAVWLAGTYIILEAFGFLIAAAYVFALALLEVNLLRKSCVDCSYYGKTCFSGRGRLCAKLFSKGDPGRFASRSISWKDIMPDMAVAFVPIACGVGLLIVDFSWLVLFAVIVLLMLSTMGNALLRGKLACRHCRQRVLGCPAERLFNKEGKAEKGSG